MIIFFDIHKGDTSYSSGVIGRFIEGRSLVQHKSNDDWVKGFVSGNLIVYCMSGLPYKVKRSVSVLASWLGVSIQDWIIHVVGLNWD
jgi:hypothetical protein